MALDEGRDPSRIMPGGHVDVHVSGASTWSRRSALSRRDHGPSARRDRDPGRAAEISYRCENAAGSFSMTSFATAAVLAWMVMVSSTLCAYPPANTIATGT